MGLIASAAGTFYTYKFLRILTQDWKDTPAFKNGIVDAKGKVLRKASTLNSNEKDEYTPFHRLVFNIKRLIEKLPINNKLTSYAAALYLLKENYDIDMETILEELEAEQDLTESAWFIGEDNHLSPGLYKLKENIHDQISDTFFNKGSSVIVNENNHKGNVMNVGIYNVQHKLSSINLTVTANQLEKGKL